MAQVINFPKTIGIAFHSLLFIALYKERMNVERIAELTHSSKFHSAKILKELVKYGYLKSTRGPSGGFELTKNAEQITLLEIWEIVEGRFQIRKCLSGQNGCIGVGCIFSDKIYAIQKKLYDWLKNTTVESMVEEMNAGSTVIPLKQKN